MKFDLNDFNYMDWNNPEKKAKVNKILDILNNLTEEQKKAVNEYGQSQWSDGFTQGERQ